MGKLTSVPVRYAKSGPIGKLATVGDGDGLWLTSQGTNNRKTWVILRRRVRPMHVALLGPAART
jgi:hypothetical protein